MDRIKKRKAKQNTKEAPKEARSIEEIPPLSYTNTIFNVKKACKDAFKDEGRAEIEAMKPRPSSFWECTY
jgi:hypothetical protein